MVVSSTWKNVQAWSFGEGQDPTRGTFFWTDDPFVTTDSLEMKTGMRMLELCAGKIKILLQHLKSVKQIGNSLTGSSFRMLGFQGGTFTIESQFGKVPEDFIMDDVHCVGTEKDIR